MPLAKAQGTRLPLLSLSILHFGGWRPSIVLKFASQNNRVVKGIFVKRELPILTREITDFCVVKRDSAGNVFNYLKNTTFRAKALRREVMAVFH